MPRRLLNFLLVLAAAGYACLVWAVARRVAASSGPAWAALVASTGAAPPLLVWDWWRGPRKAG